MRSVSISADPGEQLPSTERLDQIVVGPGFDSLDPGLLAGPGREHDHRRVAERRVFSHSLSSPKPSRRGIITSVRIRSGFCRRAASSAASPSADGLNLVPSRQQPGHVLAQILVVVGKQHPAGVRLFGLGDAVVLADSGVDFARDAPLEAPCSRGNPVQGLFDDTGAAPIAVDARALGAAMRSAGRCSVPRGIRTRNVVPRSTWLSTSIVAAVQPDQFLNQGETDSRPFVRPRRAALNAVKPLEEPREFLGGNARSRVAHRQLGMVVDAAKRDGDLPFKCVFERVRKQIEDNLLPHVAIDVHRFIERRTIEHEPQLGAFHGRAKSARQIAGERGQIGRLVIRLHAGRFDPRKVEQRIDQLEQPQTVAMRHRQVGLASRSGIASGGSESTSCSGPSIKVSGVRNSWLTFEKNVVFARSNSARASTCLRSSS